MKQAFFDLIRSTLSRKDAQAQHAEPSVRDDKVDTLRTLDLTELRQVAGATGADNSPRRGW